MRGWGRGGCGLIDFRETSLVRGDVMTILGRATFGGPGITKGVKKTDVRDRPQQ